MCTRKCHWLTAFLVLSDQVLPAWRCVAYLWSQRLRSADAVLDVDLTLARPRLNSTFAHWNVSQEHPIRAHVSRHISFERYETSRTMSSALHKPKTRAAPALGAERPRRVRTGCLTCRERHLKCDEAIPDCQNCRRSHRVCKRGVKLNFLDIQLHELAEIPPVESWKGL